MTPWRRFLPTFLAERTDLYTLGAEYTDAVAEAGGVPLILPHLEPEWADEVLDTLDGLVLCGGDDIDPAAYGAEDEGVSYGVSARADRWELTLARKAVERQLPLLGICRGVQLLNVAFGGTLRQHIGQPDTPHPPNPKDPEAIMAQRHPITIRPGSRLATIYGTEERVVNTIHHQGLDRVADGFEAVAWAPDGMVEAIEPVDPAVPAVAVQWHPEKIIEDGERALFAAFLDEVQAKREAGAGARP